MTTVKFWLKKAWLWVLLGLVVALGLVAALWRWERGKRQVAEARARVAEMLSDLRGRRHAAAVTEAEELRDAAESEQDVRAEADEQRSRDAAAADARSKDIAAAAGDDDRVRDVLTDALRRP